MMKRLFLTLLLMFITVTVFAEDIRVNLLRDQESVQVEALAPFAVTDLNTGNHKDINAGRYYLSVRGGALYLNDDMIGDKVQISRKDGGELPMINQKQYNGVFYATPRAGRVHLNNVVDLEFFLTSVLPPRPVPFGRMRP